MEAMNTDPTSEVHSDPDILGGDPVFYDTRVRCVDIVACLRAGNTMEEILAAHPSLPREVLYTFAMRWPHIRGHRYD
jgi:uncharacterized protein (DUF433 family)